MHSDNLMTDIYGANLYNRYLAQQHTAMVTSTKLVAEGTGSQVTVAAEELVSVAAQCRSILVCKVSTASVICFVGDNK